MAARLRRSFGTGHPALTGSGRPATARALRSRGRTGPSLADCHTQADDVTEMTRSDCVDIAVTTNGVLTYDEIGGHLRPACGNRPVQIDLSGLKFIDPAGLVSLAVVAERATLLRRPVRFRKPEGGDVANYLTRMRLGGCLFCVYRDPEGNSVGFGSLDYCLDYSRFTGGLPFHQKQGGRLVDEGASLPQLVIVDGGKGQLSMAVKALKDLNLWGQIPVIGIAKRLEEIYVPNDPLPLYIDKKSESLRLIQRMRDEVHRFGITFHRSRRDAGTLKTELTDVKGLGPITADKLLNKFKSVKKIRELSESELIAEVGNAKAKVLQGYFAQHESPSHPMPAKQLPD